MAFAKPDWLKLAPSRASARRRWTAVHAFVVDAWTGRSVYILVAVVGEIMPIDSDVSESKSKTPVVSCFRGKGAHKSNSGFRHDHFRHLGVVGSRERRGLEEALKQLA